MACAGAWALGVACGGNGDDGASDAVEAPGNGQVGPVSRCPGLEPRAGSPCAAPEGTTCLFGACRATVGRCHLGRWETTTLEQGGDTCPELPPTPGSPCPECWPPSAVCRYGDSACSADGSANPTSASCPAESWVVTVLACDGGASDGGANEDGGEGGDAGGE